MTTSTKCGLFHAGAAIPLEGVRIDARLSGACLDVTVSQRYRNRESVPVEAVYVFPLEEAAAVCGFAARIGDKLVQGKVEEREKAFATYDDALSNGHGAFLLDQERPNVFTASVGNLRAGEAVELSVRYVALVTREGDAVRVAIPTTVSPRYVPAGPAEVGQPDGERVNPEHWPRVPYGLELKVEVQGSARRLESPSHPIRSILGDGSATVELAQESVALDRDFVLLVETAEPRRPLARVAREADGRRVAMITFLPEDLRKEQGHEVLFLLDCSGSMAGESIAQARRALSLCIRALGAGDTFNIVCFGSSFQALWKTPRGFDERSLQEATEQVAKIEANLGGTEILAPLKALLEARVDAGRPRRVLLLTDGQVSNEAEVLSLARKHADSARIFAFGIGAGASEHLVRGTARASRGAAEMIFPGERIEPKVLRTFGRVRGPVLDDARIDWKGLGVEQAPARLPPVFDGDTLTVFARVESGSTDHVELAAGGATFRVPLDLERPEADGPIPTLWARECIRELDDLESRGGSQQRRAEADQRRRARLVELGTRYGLVSSATSFVAIEERADKDRTNQPAELRRIPVALTTGWGAEDLGSGALRSLSVMAAPAAAPRMRAMSRSVVSAPMAPAAPGFFARAKQAIFGTDHHDLMEDRLAAAAPMANQPSEPSDRVFELLMTQRADGSFPISRELTSWLDAETNARLREAAKAHGEAVAATALVIALLARDEPARETEWRPAVTKAKAWLAGQPTFDAARVLTT
jgi:Ca-activated chloride channel family protein